jgi:hypothetical protein
MSDPFPGWAMTDSEIAQVVGMLRSTPISVIVVVTTKGEIATLPPFTPTPDAPDVPTWLRQFADMYERGEPL